MESFVGTAARVIIILLMVSMGLRLAQGSPTALWRRPRLLAGSIVAAFVVVPAATYLVFQIVPLTFAAKAGLWVVAIAPGAPMIHTTALRRVPCDPDLAASFQVTVALLVIIFAPLWLLVASALTGSDYHMDPLRILKQVSLVQLVPILLGFAIHRKWPGPAERAGTFLGKIGLAALAALILLILAFVARRVVSGVEGWEVLAAALVAASAIAAGHYLTGPELRTRATIADANAQRNVGLALAIAAWNLPDLRADIALVIVVYVLTAALAEAVYTKIIAMRQAA